ncbi:MAG: hypothetical protein KAJ19_09340 [Gammaproteobacteria bacterium]|nr:hypothetical protein [Gammaproteobacteria bacterium]
MATDSTIQLRRKLPGVVDNASSADQLRLFLDDSTGLLAVKDVAGVVTIIGGVGNISFLHLGTVAFGDSPYTSTLRETVSVDPSGGVVIVELPTAINNAGKQVKVISLSPQPGPPANIITVRGILAQTVNGDVTGFDLTTAEESLLVESDGTNWLIAG